MKLDVFEFINREPKNRTEAILQNVLVFGALGTLIVLVSLFN